MILRGAEIFSAGTWPGSTQVTLGETDIQGIVDTFEALRLHGRVPMKLTHDGPDQRDEEFDPVKALAMGWVRRVWRDGKKLMADLDVPDKVHKLIKEGYLKFVSIELLKDVRAFNRVIPWVLDAVALLGADQPAVGILGDLQALTLQRRRCDFTSGTRVAFRRGDSTEGSDMDEKQIQELLKKQREESDATLAKLTARLDAADKRAADAEKERDEAAKKHKAENIKAKRTSIDALFNAAIEAKAKGGDFVEPAVREQFAKFTRYDKDDAATEAVEIKDVEAYIKDNAKKGAKVAASATKEGDADVDYSKMTPDLELLARARIRCKANGGDPSKSEDVLKASKEELRSNTELANKYKRLHMGGKAA
jgi:hypothetical protein